MNESVRFRVYYSLKNPFRLSSILSFFFVQDVKKPWSGYLFEFFMVGQQAEGGGNDTLQ